MVCHLAEKPSFVSLVFGVLFFNKKVRVVHTDFWQPSLAFYLISTRKEVDPVAPSLSTTFTVTVYVPGDE
jgi:hypothetical protein